MVHCIIGIIQAVQQVVILYKSTSHVTHLLLFLSCMNYVLC